MSASGRYGGEGLDLDAWSDLVADRLLPLAVHSAAGDEFTASLHGRDAGAVRLAHVVATAHQAVRTERQAAAGDPVLWLGIQLRGRSVLEQEGVRSELRPGDVALYDSTRPYRREFPGESETFVALVPQQLIALPPRALARMPGARITAADRMGPLLSALLSALSGSFDDLEDAQLQAAVRAVVDLTTAAFADHGGVAVPAASRQAELLMRIRAWMMARLGDPDLSPQSIAAAHYVSVRTLHALFRAQGTTVGTWMRERRLEMARRDLVDGADDEVRTVAARWGFDDPAYFARAFRAAYRQSPTGYRREHAVR